MTKFRQPHLHPEPSPWSEGTRCCRTRVSSPLVLLACGVLACVAVAQPYPVTPGARHRQFPARRRGRHHDAPRHREARGRPRPAVPGRQPRGRGRQYRRRARLARRARRLHPARRDRRRGREPDGVPEDSVRSHPRFHADRDDGVGALRAGGASVGAGEDRSRSSSRSRSRSRASSPTRRPAPAARPTWRESCSRCCRAPTCSTCRTRAWCRPRPT